MDAQAPLLAVAGLRVQAPDGRQILDALDFELERGEVVVLLGGSGSGKSTLMRALDDPNALRRDGFDVVFDKRKLATPVGIVPQRGALFDHLDVRGNLALAMRNAATQEGDGPRAGPPDDAKLVAALEGVDLPGDWARASRDCSGLSGGEAQRVAVARTLAGGRRILFMDEPSVGLDPLRVDRLADLLRKEIRERDAAALVVTHELEFAAGVADRFVYMDRERAELVELKIDLEGDRSDRVWREQVAAQLGQQVVRRLASEAAAKGGGRESKSKGLDLRRMFAPFAVPIEVLKNLPRALRRPRDFSEVFAVVGKQSALRPALFFAIVSLLIGVTMLYILHRALGGGEMPLRADRVFSLIGSMHVIALAPPLCGILFSATSGNAITAWLGGVSLTRQDEALRGLGISESRYLWVPAWVALTGSFMLMAVLFTGGMLLGGAAYLVSQVPELSGGFSQAWELVTADLLDPPSDRAVFRTRMLWLFGLYAAGIASDAVAKGAEPKRSAESVTVSMVRAVMASTGWIVLLELASLVWIFAGRGA